MIRHALRERSIASRAKNAVTCCSRSTLVRDRRACCKPNHHVAFFLSRDSTIRHFATNVSEPVQSKVEVANNLDMLTRSVLNTKNHPVGTMTAKQWNNCLSAMTYWLLGDTPQEGFQDKKLGQIQVPSVIPFSGYSVDAAERILQRLLVEYATRSLHARGHALGPFLIIVLDGWLQLSDHHPGSQLAVERAQNTWSRILSTRALLADEAPLPIQHFARLVEAWLRLETENGVYGASNLLLSESMEEIAMNSEPSTRKRLISSFQNARRISPDKDLKFKMRERMDILAKVPGWEPLLHLDDDELVEEYFERAAAPESKSNMSSLEARRMGQRLLELVQKAGPDDLDAVKHIISNWDAKREGVEMTVLLSEAVFDLYVRLKDLKEAGEWLLRLEQLRPDDRRSHLAKISTLIKLWSVNDDPQARWRVSELLMKLDAMSLLANIKVEPDICITAAKLFLDHADVDNTACKKVIDIVKMARSFDKDLLSLAMIAVVKDTSPSPSVVSDILKLLESNWNEISPEQMLSFAEAASRVVASSKMSEHAIPLVKFLSSKGIASSTAICEFAIESLSHSSSPGDIVSLFDMLEGNEAPLTFDMYKKAIHILLGMYHVRKIRQVTDILQRLLQRISKGEIAMDIAALGKLILSVINVICFYRREQDALGLLSHVEKQARDSTVDISSAITLDVYKSVMAVLLSRNCFDQVEQLFQRVKSHYEAGAARLLPDRDIYNIYITALSKKGVHPDKQENVLAELSTWYERTGRPELKPRDKTFNSVLADLRKSTIKDRYLIPRMMALVERMVALQVEFKDTHGFHTAMMIALRDEKPFQTTMKIVALMEKAGLEPDAYVFHTMLVACTRSGGERAIMTAVSTLGRIRSAGGHIKPTRYLLVIECLNRNSRRSDSRRFLLAKAIFPLCCEDGCLDSVVKKAFKNLVGRESWDRLYNASLLEGGREPKEWSRNVGA